jgi:hypothetical protein
MLMNFARGSLTNFGNHYKNTAFSGGMGEEAVLQLLRQDWVYWVMGGALGWVLG